MLGYFCVEISHKQNLFVVAVSVKGSNKIIKITFIILRWRMIPSEGSNLPFYEIKFYKKPFNIVWETMFF